MANLKKDEADDMLDILKSSKKRSVNTNVTPIIRDEIADSHRTLAPLSTLVCSTDNIDYDDNLHDNEVVMSIIGQFLDIDPDILKRSDGLSSAMLMEKGNPFTLVLNKFRSNPRALELLGLFGSVQNVGLTQPILVRQVRGQNIIIDGMRRFLACQALDIDPVPIHVTESEASDLELSVIAALQRRSRTESEKIGEAIEKLYEMVPGMTQTQVGIILGKSQWDISRYSKAYNERRAVAAGAPPKPKKVQENIFNDSTWRIQVTGPEHLSDEDKKALVSFFVSKIYKK